jgi:hypothetical protein
MRYFLGQYETEEGSLITLNFSSLLQLSTQTLKSVHLGYISFNYFQFQPSVKIFR